MAPHECVWLSSSMIRWGGQREEINNSADPKQFTFVPQKKLVLPFAPEEPRGEDFTTETMNIMDAILSRIGKDDDGLGPNWSSTERIVHKFHMIDVWHRVREVYQEVLENPPQVT